MYFEYLVEFEFGGVEVDLVDGFDEGFGGRHGVEPVVEGLERRVGQEEGSELGDQRGRRHRVRQPPRNRPP